MYGQRVSRSFKDISLSFEPHPITKDLPVLKNANAIRRSVRNLVQTIPGERFFNPILGSSVYDSLFDLMDFGTSNLIEQEIITTLRNFEPRVNNVRVRVSVQDLTKTTLMLRFSLILLEQHYHLKNFHSS